MSTIEENHVTDDPVALVHLRNEFYRHKYNVTLGIYFLSLLCIVILVCSLYYLARHPTKPLYFATDSVGRLLPEVSLDSPSMTTQQVSDWVVQALQDTYSYDFVNYRAQLQNAQKYFTAYGWSQYMKGLQQSDNLLALSRYKYVIIAKVASTPVLLNQGLLGGHYAWKFQMPVLITYLEPPYDGKTGFQNPLLVTVIVQRQELLTSYQGLGILQMIGVLQTNPNAAPNLTTPS